MLVNAEADAAGRGVRKQNSRPASGSAVPFAPALFAVPELQGRRMLTLIAHLAGSLLVAPILVAGTRLLFAKFVREGAGLFIDLDIHREWADVLSGPIAWLNGAVFTLAWWVAAVLATLKCPAIAVVSPFLAAVPLGFAVTCWFLKARLRLGVWPACSVSLLTFAGGNLPMVILIPVLLMMVLSG